MPLVGFEPTILAFKWAKTFHALDGAAKYDYCFEMPNGTHLVGGPHKRKRSL
jgi:hypothetical protein